MQASLKPLPATDIKHGPRGGVHGKSIQDQEIVSQSQFGNTTRPGVQTSGQGLLGPAPVVAQGQMNMARIPVGQSNISMRQGLLNLPGESKIGSQAPVQGMGIHLGEPNSSSAVGLLGPRPLVPQVVEKYGPARGPVTASVTSEELEVARRFGEASGVKDMAVLLQAVRLVKQIEPQVLNSLGNLKNVIMQLQMGKITLQDASRILPAPVIEMIANGTMGPQLIQLLTGGLGQMGQQGGILGEKPVGLFDLNVIPTKRMRECSPIRRPKHRDPPRRPGALAAALSSQKQRDRSPLRRETRSDKDKRSSRERNKDQPRERKSEQSKQDTSKKDAAKDTKNKH